MSNITELMNANIGTIPVEQMMNVASLAVLVYDYFLTLDSEIERFWKRGLNYGLVLFFANRYLALLGYFPKAIERSRQTEIDPSRCRLILGIYTAIWGFVMSIIVSGMMLMRVWALYRGRIRVLVFPMIVAICAIIIGTVGVAKTPSKDTPEVPFRCDSGYTKEQAYYLAGAYGGELVFDIAIFAMMLYKALTLPKGRGIGLLTTLVRDGTVYFGAMVTLNAVNILVLVLADPVNSAAMVSPMIIALSILMTRLMLNLRDPQLNAAAEDFKTTTVNIYGFNEQRGTEVTTGDSMNVDDHESGI